MIPRGSVATATDLSSIASVPILQSRLGSIVIVNWSRMVLDIIGGLLGEQGFGRCGVYAPPFCRPFGVEPLRVSSRAGCH
jgi:hypothetical protein